MKKLQRLCVATVFTLVLTSANLAGEIQTPGVPTPTPSPTPTHIVESSRTSEVDVSESNLLTDFAFDFVLVIVLRKGAYVV